MNDLGMSDQVAHPLVLFRNHLEFLGYNVEEATENLVCRHTRRPNLILKPISDRGVLVSALYTLHEDLDRLEVLEYTNALNRALVFMKALVEEEEDLVLETFFEGHYDRTNFAILLDNVDYDMRTFLDSESTQKYVS
ncbi:MAG: DNA mismatch repair protein [Cyanobacteria bacterium P01_A01_bin.123]